MDELTPNQRLANALLGEPLETFVVSRKVQGLSWRLIARDLRDATGGQVDVTEQTLQNWYGQKADSAAGAA